LIRELNMGTLNKETTSYSFSVDTHPKWFYILGLTISFSYKNPLYEAKCVKYCG
jgi:hypothetical protein